MYNMAVVNKNTHHYFMCILFGLILPQFVAVQSCKTSCPIISHTGSTVIPIILRVKDTIFN